MSNPIRLALLWVTMCLAITLTIFTGVDLNSGIQSTALWIALFSWPVVAAICGYLLRIEGKPQIEEQD